MKRNELWAIGLSVAIIVASTHPAFAQTAIPDGGGVLRMGDALMLYLRRNFGPVILGLVVLVALFSCGAGDVRGGVGRAIGGLFIAALIGASVYWYPWMKTLFA